MSGGYLVAGRPAGFDAFQSRALDPAASVVISACAGAGKTTLLVGRMVRALLEGCRPDRILAVTFTRKAAAEMRRRLMESLRELALADEPAVHALLRRFAVPPERAERLVPAARLLYERVLTDPRGPTIATFHSWFWQLVQQAPDVCGVPPEADLSAGDAVLIDSARRDWLERLREPGRAGLRAEFDALVGELGERPAEDALQAALRRRVELLVALDGAADAPAHAVAQAAARMADSAWTTLAEAVGRFVGDNAPSGRDAAVRAQAPDAARILSRLRADVQVRAGLARFARLLDRGGASCARLSVALDEALAALDDAGVPLAHAERLVRDAVLTRRGTARVWSAGTRPADGFARALADAGDEPGLQAAWQALAARVSAWSDLVAEAQALRINDRLMRLAADRIAHFQAFKRARRAVDFGDVELMALRLMADDAAAAEAQSRLDLRYAQLLFDEFQDTSALQWRVLSDWLASYGGVGSRPAVCIVGDARQAIYRFRRADSRVFEAARGLLVDTFGAVELTTDTTWRVAPVVLERIDACLAADAADAADASATAFGTAAARPGAFGLPHAPRAGFRRHATRRDAPGLVWRLPLAADEPTPDVPTPDTSAGAPRDWFTEPRRRDRRHRHFIEGADIARALHAVRERLAVAGQPVRWRDVLVLARRRSHFARYEHALRAAGIPVVSDRLGGLLDRLEVSDLLALLRWLWRPADDLALVQVLKSPLFDVDDASLAALGRERDAPWWERLRRRCGDAQGERGGPGGPGASPCSADGPLREAAVQLAAWRELAERLPVHDLLDRILHERDAYARYAAAVPASQREVVRANLDALLGLALDLDGASLPGLPEFLDAVRALARASEHDAPGEGIADQIDAVQLMTIHGAKGLEAEVVVVADVNGAARSPGGWQPLVGWTPPERAPRHVSFVHGTRCHPSRQDWIDAEAQAARIEDWNLLYVGLTRARTALIVSGARNDHAAPDNWYARLEPLPLPDWPEAPGLPATGSGPGAAADQSEIVWHRFRPEPSGLIEPPVAATEAAARQAGLDAALQRAFEALPGATPMTRESQTARSEPDTARLERGTARSECEAAVRAALASTRLDAASRARLQAVVMRLIESVDLRGCFDGSAQAAGPLEAFDAAGRLLRIDRWVEFDDEDWIVDWQALLAALAGAGADADADADANVLEAARARLASRRSVMAALAPGRRLRTVLVHADAAGVTFDADLSGQGSHAC